MAENKIKKFGKGMEITLAYAILTDGERCIAVAPHLNVVGYGKNAREAQADFDKAVITFMEFHEKHKNLEAKLLNLGWKMMDHKPVPPQDFTVPMELLMGAHIQKTSSKAYATACH